MATTETTTATSTDDGGQRHMSMRTVRAFFALTFGLGWGLGLLMVLFTDQIEAIFGEISGTNPVFVLVVYSPAIAGVYLVWRHYGVEGLRGFFRRVTLWRLPGAWWLFLILGIPAVKYLGAAINGTIGEFPYSPWYNMLPALAVVLFIGPVEEFGWRGVALPLLQRRYAPLWVDPGRILGSVAPARLSPQWDTPERLVVRPVRHRGACDLCLDDADVQRRTGEHPHRRPVPLPAERPGMARSPTLGELHRRSHSRSGRGTESENDAAS